LKNGRMEKLIVIDANWSHHREKLGRNLVQQREVSWTKSHSSDQTN
jgi:hypothetical protein